MEENVIANLVDYLKEKEPKTAVDLISRVHSYGVNVRYLGVIFRKLQDQKEQQQSSESRSVNDISNLRSSSLNYTSDLLRLILIEIISRVAKVKLIQLQRENKADKDVAIVSFINLLFFLSSDSPNYWLNSLSQQCQVQFLGFKILQSDILIAQAQVTKIFFFCVNDKFLILQTRMRIFLRIYLNDCRNCQE